MAAIQFLSPLNATAIPPKGLAEYRRLGLNRQSHLFNNSPTHRYREAWRQFQLSDLPALLKSGRNVEMLQVGIGEKPHGETLNLLEFVMRDHPERFNFSVLDLQEQNLRSLISTNEIPTSIKARMKYLLGDVVDSQLSQVNFDLIVCLNVLVHFKDGQAQLLALANLARSLRPGGLLVTEDFSDRYAPRREGETKLFDHFHRPDSEAILKEIGLKKHEWPLVNYFGVKVIVLEKLADA